MTQSPSDPNILVVGTNRGIFRSKDAGETWEQLPTSAYPDLINVESLAIDPRNPDIIYAGTWHLPWKTIDGGRTWSSIKTGMIDDSDVFAIEINRRDPNHVIASACSGIYESRNGAAKWRKIQGIPSQSRRTRAILLHPTMPQVIFAGTTEGFWRSANGGSQWMVTTSRQLEINAIAVHPSNPQTVYIGTNNYGVMISRDGGKNFTPSNEGFSSRRTYAILPDREKPGRVYATTINTATGGGFFFVSNDGGATWQPSMRNMPNRLIGYSILQDPRDGNIIYLGTNLGLYRSLDRGTSWSPIGAPKPETPPARKGRRRGARSASQRTAPTTPPAAPKRPDEMVKRAQEALKLAGFYVGKPDGTLGPRTVAAIRTFQTKKAIPQTGILDEKTLTALGLAGGMQTLNSAEGLQTALITLADTINTLAYLKDANGQINILAATNNGLYRSSDPAKGWEKLPFGPNLDARTLAVSANEQNPQTIWVGTSTSGVLVSRDGGTTWNQIESIPKTAPINMIVQDPQRSAYVYVGTTQTLYVSHDGGEKWVRRGGNLPYGSYTSILINPQNGDEIFVGSAFERAAGNGVFRSSDAGMTWERVDPDLPSRRVWALALDPRDPTKIFVGSHSAGVYVAHLGSSAAASSKTEQQ